MPAKSSVLYLQPARVMVYKCAVARSSAQAGAMLGISDSLFWCQGGALVALGGLSVCGCVNG